MAKHENGKDLAVIDARDPMALVPSGISADTFRRFIAKHGLTLEQSRLVFEINQAHRASISYIDGLLREGIDLPYIHAAYQLRDELGTLHNMETSTGNISAEFILPIDRVCEFLSRAFPESDGIDEELLEAIMRLFCEVADRYPQVVTWSSILNILTDALHPLKHATEQRIGNMLDLPPFEMIGIWIDLLDETDILSSG